MKKILITLIVGLTVCSCLDKGYSDVNMTSVSDFEYSISEFTDSLFLSSYFFAGGSGGYSNLVFNSYHPEDGVDMTGGFGITAKRDTSLVIKSDNKYPQYTIYGDSAASESEMCAVFYQNTAKSLMPEHHIIFGDVDYGTCAPNYCYINNTQKTVYDVLESDDKFEYGDYLKLTVTGYLNDTKTGSVEYYLADHRGHTDSPDSVLTNWKVLSLARLGSIEYIDFELSSNRASFPSTFCLDNLVMSIYIRY